MSVIRVSKPRARFTVLSTATLRTASLSLKARGLWALCMSYPDDWEFRASHLRSQSARDGRDAVQGALKELEAAGLAVLETPRDAEGRLLGRRWTIYEEAALNPSSVLRPAQEPVADEAAGGEATGGEATGGEATDDRETGPSAAHRQTGFPTTGKPERRESRRTGNPPLRKNKQNEASSPRKTEQQQASLGASQPEVGASQASLGASQPEVGAGQARLGVSQPKVGARVGPVPLRAIVGDGGGKAAAVVLVNGVGEAAEDAQATLVRRGVDPSVAADLATGHGAEAIARAVALYDARRAGPSPPSGPGWLVAAVRRGFEAPAAPEARLLTHAEMLRWCEANGGLHRTSEFEAVARDGQATLFRRAAPSGGIPSPRPAPGATLR